MRMTVVVVMVVIVAFVVMVFAMSVCGVVMRFVVRMPVRALRMVAMIVALTVRVCRVIMSLLVRVPMGALRMVSVIVALAVRMVVRVSMIVIVPVMFVEDLLRERIVLYKRLVMAMLVTAAIRARLRLERRRRVIHMRAQTLQHVFQHRIGFQFQLPRSHFHRRVTIAQVVRGARQRNRIVSVYNQHILRRCNHAHEAAVVGDQHVTVAQHRAARQHQRNLLTVIQRSGQAALAAVIEGKGQGRRAFDQRCGQFRFDTFVNRAHESLGNQNRK